MSERGDDMPHDNPFDPKGHELWPAFVGFLEGKRIPVEETTEGCTACQPHGIDWSCPICNGKGTVPYGGMEQWIKWWECFLAGSGAQFQLDMVGEVEEYRPPSADLGQIPSQRSFENRSDPNRPDRIVVTGPHDPGMILGRCPVCDGAYQTKDGITPFHYMECAPERCEGVGQPLGRRR